MTGRDLLLEYGSALWRTMAEDVQPLRAAGITETMLRLLPVALDRITVRGQLYEPDPDGGFAYILAVRADNPATPKTPDPETVIADGDMVDLIAFHPAYPRRWALRVGAAEWLGAVEPQYMQPAPVRIWRSPLAWLRAGCRGLVLLSNDRRDQYRHLASLGSIIAEDAHHAAELQQLLEHPWPTPTVLVGNRDHHLHAA